MKTGRVIALWEAPNPSTASPASFTGSRFQRAAGIRCSEMVACNGTVCRDLKRAQLCTSFSLRMAAGSPAFDRRRYGTAIAARRRSSSSAPAKHFRRPRATHRAVKQSDGSAAVKVWFENCALSEVKERAKPSDFISVVSIVGILAVG